MIADIEARRVADGYLHVVGGLLRDLDMAAVMRVCGVLHEARERGRTIYLAGNGGSAATASHWSNDLNKATRRPDAPACRAISLSDHLSWMTALANDEGYERAFAGQLENLAQPGDVLVVFSASGNSPNLVAAVRVAQARGARTIGVLGFDGGVLKPMVDDSIWLPTAKGLYGPVEDAHLVICHVLTTCLAAAAIEVAR